MPFILGYTPDNKHVRINVEHILYYREAGFPKGGGNQGMESGTVIYFVGTEKSLLIRLPIDEVDALIFEGPDD